MLPRTRIAVALAVLLAAASAGCGLGYPAALFSATSSSGSRSADAPADVELRDFPARAPGMAAFTIAVRNEDRGRVDLRFEYSLDGGATFVRATRVTGGVDEVEATTAGAVRTLIWDADGELGGARRVRVRITAVEVGFAERSVTTPEIEVGNDQPEVAGAEAPAQATGLVAVRFRLFDTSADVVSLRPTFRFGALTGPASSATFPPTAILTSRTRPGVEQVFVWDTMRDVGRKNGTATLTLRAEDSEPGAVTATVTIEIRNNAQPIVQVTRPRGEPLGGIVTVPFDLIDEEADPCAISVEVSTDGGARFEPATRYAGFPDAGATGLASSSDVARGARHIFAWDSVADTGLGARSVRLRFTPDDGTPGVPDMTGTFVVDNFPLSERAIDTGQLLLSSDPEDDPIATGDVTGDGFADIVRTFANGSGNGGGILAISPASGGISAVRQKAFLSEPSGIAVAEVTGDGLVDVLVATHTDRAGTSGAGQAGALHVCAQRQFAIADPVVVDAPPIPLTDFGAGDPPSFPVDVGIALAAGDIDGDGLADAALRTRDEVRIYLQRPAGQGFAAPLIIPIGGAPEFPRHVGVAIVELDGAAPAEIVTRLTGESLIGEPSSRTDLVALAPVVASATAQVIDLGETDWPPQVAIRVEGAPEAILGFARPDTGVGVILRYDPADASPVSVLAPLFVNDGRFRLADVNGDGLVDGVAFNVSGTTNEVHVFYQTPAGFQEDFSDVILGPVGPRGDGSDVVDVDGDGRLDIVDGGMVFLNQGDDSNFGFRDAPRPPGFRFDLVRDIEGEGLRVPLEIRARRTGLWLRARLTRFDFVEYPGLRDAGHMGQPHFLAPELDGDGLADAIFLGNEIPFNLGPVALLQQAAGELDRTRRLEDGLFDAEVENPFLFLGPVAAVGDATGDGRADVAVSAEAEVRLLRQLPDGTFAATAAAADGSALAVALAANAGPAGQRVIAAAIVAGAVGAGPRSLAIVAYVAGAGGALAAEAPVAVTSSAGTGEFAVIAWQMLAADVNGDGRDDLLVSGETDFGDPGARQFVAILRRAADGSRFLAPQVLAGCAEQVIDVDRDGTVDLVGAFGPIPHFSSSANRFDLRGQAPAPAGVLWGGGGGFSLDAAAGAFAARLARDVDGDGRLDLVGWGGTTVQLQMADGRFEARTAVGGGRFNAPQSDQAPVVADFDGDGRADFALPQGIVFAGASGLGRQQGLPVGIRFPEVAGLFDRDPYPDFLTEDAFLVAGRVLRPTPSGVMGPTGLVLQAVPGAAHLGGLGLELPAGALPLDTAVHAVPVEGTPLPSGFSPLGPAISFLPDVPLAAGTADIAFALPRNLDGSAGNAARPLTLFRLDAATGRRVAVPVPISAKSGLAAGTGLTQLGTYRLGVANTPPVALFLSAVAIPNAADPAATDVEITYMLFDAESDPVDVTIGYWIPDASATPVYELCGESGRLGLDDQGRRLLPPEGTRALATEPGRNTHTFIWNSSLNLLDFADVRIRIFPRDLDAGESSESGVITVVPQ